MMVQMGKTVTNSRDVGVEDLQLLGDGDTYERYWDDGRLHGGKHPGFGDMIK